MVPTMTKPDRQVTFFASPPWGEVPLSRGGGVYSRQSPPSVTPSARHLPAVTGREENKALTLLPHHTNRQGKTTT